MWYKLCVMMIGVFCCSVSICVVFFFFKQKTAYEMRISDWSSDVCSSDLVAKIETGNMTIEHAAMDVRAELRDVARMWEEQARAKGIDFVKIGRASCRERVCQYV